jgi:2-polyprenyl-6-hydroxyphenyl methylase/3-demethylubiquinone-9 3-methyltransferase
LSSHPADIKRGERFEFGRNWQKFLSVLNDERIAEAEKSLRGMLDTDSLDGQSFLDIGCGSGLFSLAARRLGARVHSFDYDPRSAACASELKRRYFASDDNWTIEEGSALDAEYLRSLGHFDVVYSWGVLHHTGRMWNAMALAAEPVAVGGKLFISIYNDQGPRSAFWRRVKKTYCSWRIGRAIVVGIFVPAFVLYGLVFDVVSGTNPARRYTDYKRMRGMSIYYDWFDWLGGYPFEVARPEAVFDFYTARGFRLRKLQTTNSHGTNQFVFQRQL